MKTSINRCEHCGASLAKYWHKLTPILIRALIKTLKIVKQTDKNSVSISDIELTHGEYGNYQKLRFHGLIAKHKDELGRWDKTWLITDRGGKFLRGEISVPQKVQTFRNHVVAHSAELVNISYVNRSLPYVEQTFLRELADESEIREAVQLRMV